MEEVAPDLGCEKVRVGLEAASTGTGEESVQPVCG